MICGSLITTFTTIGGAISTVTGIFGGASVAAGGTAHVSRWIRISSRNFREYS